MLLRSASKHYSSIELFHDGGFYHIEIRPMTCRAIQWTFLYMIEDSVMKKLINLEIWKTWTFRFLDLSANLKKAIRPFISNGSNFLWFEKNNDKALKFHLKTFSYFQTGASLFLALPFKRRHTFKSWNK